MAYHCDKCRQKKDVLYAYAFSRYCEKCLKSMYDVCVSENEYFVCDECGRDCDILYRDGDYGLCTDCLFDVVDKV